uniref:Uncharacterized protein n=1 Tax=Arundo donax TaxID=35708 RepID=A0A0A8ZV69_ARUDO
MTIICRRTHLFWWIELHLAMPLVRSAPVLEPGSRPFTLSLPIAIYCSLRIRNLRLP